MASTTVERPLEPLFGDYPPYTLSFRLRGVMPLLFNALHHYAEEDPGEVKRPRHEPPDFEEMVWRSDDGNLAIPTANVVASIAHAGRYFKTPIGSRGSAKTTLQEAMVPSEHLSSFGVPEWDEIHFSICRYKNQNRSPKPTSRPMLNKGWKCEGAFSVITPEVYSPTRILEVFSLAGRICGIGDGRKLGYGRFVLDGTEISEGLAW